MWLLGLGVVGANSASAERDLPPGRLPLLRLAEAQRFWQEPQTIFLDVRPTEDFAAGHIPGAIHFPEEEFESRFPALRNLPGTAQAIVVYCKSKDCGKSLWTAIRLRHEGLVQTWIYPGGWNEWFVNGLPVAR